MLANKITSAGHTLPCCVLLFLSSSNVLARPAHSYGLENLDKLVSAIWDAPPSSQANPAIYRVALKKKQQHLVARLIIYTSTDAQIGAYDNRCVAESLSATITCDLNFIENFIGGLKLLERDNSIGSDESKLKRFRRDVLKWVVAHELGHIALGHPPHLAYAAMDLAGKVKRSQQAKELAADAFAQKAIGSLTTAPDDYTIILDIANAAVSRALCPSSFPASCDELNPGVGLIFNSGTDKPINVQDGTTHPDMLVRFLRLLYMAGRHTNHNSINYLAKVAMDKIEIATASGEQIKLRDVFQLP